MTEIDILKALMTRRFSCRAFLPDPVPRANIETIVTAAGRAPSWCNAQPWHAVITSGAETDRLRGALTNAATSGDKTEPDVPFPARYTGPYQDRRRACAWQLYDAVGVEKGDRAASAKQTMENFRLFGAPHCAVITTEADLGPYGMLDCGGFITAFTLAATALGVATIPQAAIAPFAPMLHAHFDLPEHRQIVCAISFGYADVDHPANSFRTPRADLDEITDWRG